MRKLLLIIQELIIVNCILGMIAFLSITVQAKGRVLDEPMAKEITGIGNYGIENPSKPIIDEAWQGNYVYFGEYDMDNDGKKEPVKYRVLSKCTTDFSGNDSTVKTMLLDCDNVFLPDGDKGMIFHELNYAVDDSKWNNSILREYLNNDFLTSSFSLQEQAAIANSVKENVAESDGDACDFQPQRWTALSGDKIFLLDAREVRNESYGYSNEQWGADNRGKICIQKPTMWEWWLRSEEEYPTLPENEGMGAGVIASKAVGCLFVNEYCGVSPVLNVRLSDILMVSIVEGTAGQTGAAYKLTLIDPAMKIRPEQSTNAQSEEQVTVPYRLTGADIDNATWVSVLFTKKDILTADGYYDAGEAIYIPNVDQDGKAVFSIPEEYRNKECGTDYHVYLIAENVNGEKETDYAKGMDPNRVMTEEEARKQLEEDIRNRFPDEIVDIILENHGTLTQNQLDALVALRFNNTAFTIKKSQEFMEVLKEKDYLDEEIRRKIASQFMTYSLQNDKRLEGLVKRSAAEAIVFLENNYLTEYDDLYSDPDVIEIYRNFLIKYEVDNLDEYLEYLE